MLKQYIGKPPETCDLCGAPIANVFVDGAVAANGSWANMCKTCHLEHGNGLGEGMGQEWWRGEDGKFYKVAG